MQDLNRGIVVYKIKYPYGDNLKRIQTSVIAFLFILFIPACDRKNFSLKGEFVKGRYAGNVFEDANVRNLAVAAAGGDVFTVYDLVTNQKVDVNSKGHDGITPLLWAFLARNKDGYRELLKNGANPDLEAKEIFSVTGLALNYIEDTEYFRLALEYGANPDHFNKRVGLPILMEACMEKFQKEQLKWIVDAGANINIRGVQGNTPVMFCADMRRYDMVVYLIEKKANTGAVDDEGLSLADKIKNNPVDPEVDPIQYKNREKVMELILQQNSVN